jgi:adenine-specific DNA-methyltransferase
MARSAARTGRTETYRHPESDLALRPEVGTQPQFRKKKPPVTYRYDSSLSPALEWDGENSVREQGEWLLALIDEASRLPSPHEFEWPSEFRGANDRVLASCRGLRDAVEQLKRLGRPFLNWAGKAERLSFDVPTLPLFVHERLSTMAIVETLKGHSKEARSPQLGMFDLFGDPQRPIADQVLKAYEYRNKWVNRMILGDSLVVMNSMLHYEGLGGQVQMIYIDPPYGVRFGSNFQPFVRKRDVTHNDDADMTREPEMVKAYRDTWELGLHSYLTYLRDRLLLARHLLHPSGSVFVQISDENAHHIRELMDDIFGAENEAGQIVVQKTGGLGTSGLKSVADYLLWYARDKERLKYRQLYSPKEAGLGEGTGERYDQLEGPNSERRSLTREERLNPRLIPEGWRPYQLDNLTSGAFRQNTTVPFEFEGEVFHPGPNACWKTTVEGLQRLVAAHRIEKAGRTLRYVRYLDDFPGFEITNVWSDVAGAANKLYVVQTSTTVIERCILMTTDPGDLVLDPTSGAGTTAYCAELWGRRWMSIDTSRVPLSLARQRLLTAIFPYYRLKDEARGPGGGFVYTRRQNRRGEEIGGVVPRVTLGMIANNELPEEVVFVDRPEIDSGVTRISGPFCVEATIPMPVDWDGDGGSDDGRGADDYGSYLDRMLDVLRRAPVLQLGGGQTVKLRNVRPPAKSLALSAEAVVDAGAGDTISLGAAIAAADKRNLGTLPFSQHPVALVFGPENGAVSERLVSEAAREAHGKSYAHLYVIGFAIQPNARQLVEQCEAVFGVPATYVQATPDLMMGDLLKTMRSSQIFSVCGMPDVRLRKLPAVGAGEPGAMRSNCSGSTCSTR